MGRYEIQLTNAQWHTEGFPAHDGEFWAILGYGEQKELSTINYTSKHGWNTSRLFNGEYETEHGWGFDNHGGYIKAWADVPPFKVVFHEA